MIAWSPQQEAAIKSAQEWLADPNGAQIFHIFGFAGTGKTTLAKEIAQNVKGGNVLFGAFTGKAASVMRRKGCAAASTIHSMIYRPKGKKNREPEWVLNHGSQVADAKLVIVDEVSMVDQKLGEDLTSFRTKILVLGDPAQLPPIKGTGYFIVEKPEVMLTEVHRQARDNPIIRMSMDIRKGMPLTPGAYGESRVITQQMLKDEQAYINVLGTDQIIVGMNRTRQAYNQRIRRRMRETAKLGGAGELPVVGDKLVCLRNDHKINVLNGTLWEVIEAGDLCDKQIKLTIKSIDDDTDKSPRTVFVREEFFYGTEAKLDWRDRRGTQQFTFGYALTCHKSQGSQWDDIIIFDEAAAFREDAIKWRYTAITRSAKTVTVVQ